MDIRLTVGQNLRRIRLERGLSQEALAHYARIAPSFLSQIENGTRSATITKLHDLAMTLRIPIAELFVEGNAPTKGLPRGRRVAKV
ncbi:helix-turn-helix domain-containing protein [Reyranella sp.]|uniref:helix-turn-helix domain-containing protein n=1 Tax=Reyranella sp. TaxID=1929291 RepID=UPI00121DF1AF|nr:MAG: XRE family transcriptional regulator [Reyranella sp.]